MHCSRWLLQSRPVALTASSRPTVLPTRPATNDLILRSSGTNYTAMQSTRTVGVVGPLHLNKALQCKPTTSSIALCLGIKYRHRHRHRHRRRRDRLLYHRPLILRMQLLSQMVPTLGRELCPMPNGHPWFSSRPCSAIRPTRTNHLAVIPVVRLRLRRWK